ncbi:MAG: DUF3306 domain-containing protein [Hyphomicrobiales bacterium]|nr:DUF3306 domain-containing protein [Hyphomicrobiales bacterium]
MTDPEHFVARWSRRKRAAIEADRTSVRDASLQDLSAEQAPSEDGPLANSSPPASASAAGEPLADVSMLPPLESIGPGTDIRGFLAPGVPLELSRAALRRAWAADPLTRDFVGLADYDWDFHTPGAIPGFGSLEASAELRRHVAQILGRDLSASEDGQVSDAGSLPPANSVEDSAGSIAADGPAREAASAPPALSAAEEPSALTDQAPRTNQVLAAAQKNPAGPHDAVAHRRSHGRALPK